MLGRSADKPYGMETRESLPDIKLSSPLVANAIKRLEKGLRSRTLFVLELVLVLTVGTALAVWMQPEPHSDWGYYWAAAGDASRYERGGLSLWLLALPKSIGLPPVPAALLLNLISAAGLLRVVRSLDPTRFRWFALLASLYLLLITPYFGIVQLDLIAAAELATGFWLLAVPSDRLGVRTRFAFATAMFATGVSTKPQYALTLWAMIGLSAILWFALRRSLHALLPLLFAALLAGSLAGFAIDSGLRAVSGRTEAIRTNSAVTLYGGLLVSGTGQGCGYWSVEAAEAAKADLKKPLYRAVLDRLSAKPLEHWTSVIACKMPEILRPPPYALYWLVESPNIRARIDADPRKDRINSIYSLALRWERKAYGTLALAILLSAAGLSLLLWRRQAPMLGLLSLTWIASFWAVHSVFEIQGRYFLGMYLLTPIICAMALRVHPSGRSATRKSGGEQWPMRLQ